MCDDEQMGRVPPAASHHERQPLRLANLETCFYDPEVSGDDAPPYDFHALEPSFTPSAPSFAPGSPTPTGEDYAPDSASNVSNSDSDSDDSDSDDSDSDLDAGAPAAPAAPDGGAPHSLKPGVCARCNKLCVRRVSDYLRAAHEVNDADGTVLVSVLVCGACNSDMVRKVKGVHDSPAEITDAAPEELFFVYAEHTRSRFVNPVFNGCLAAVTVKGTVAVMVKVDGRFLVYAVDCSGSIFGPI